MGIAIDKYLDAGYPVLYIRTGEQERALQEITANLRNSGLGDKLTVMIWKSTLGLYGHNESDPSRNRKAHSIDEALNYIAGTNSETPSDHIYVMFNIRDFLKSPIMMQQFRDTAYRIRTVGSHMILIGGSFDIPEELEDVVTFVDLELPSKEEIKSIFKSTVDRYSEVLDEPSTEHSLEQAAENALGLTAFKAENAISLSIVSSKKIDVPLIRQEKQLAVKQSGVLEYLHHQESMDSLGGFDNLKAHVKKRRKYFSQHKKAVDFGLRPPKGIMLVGVAGTGKTLAAKAVSAALELPLYKFDIGAVFKGIVGGSEAAIRNALKLAETVAPCVLLIDEMEKLVAGLESSGKTDSGVTSRVIGTLLSWMQETTAPIYKLATCNTIRNLDSALFRRGRWDAVFAVDLPTLKERKEIIAIHLEKRSRVVSEFDLDVLGKITENFVGAEIESVVDEALYFAFDEDRDLTTNDLVAVARDIVPISKTDQEAIAQFRSWMETRAMPVSGSGKGRNGSTRSPRNLRMPDGTLQ